MKKTIVGLISLIFLISCQKKNFEEIQLKNHLDSAKNNPTPTPVCDTTTITYNNSIASIFNNNCTSCHGAGNSTGYFTNSYALVVQDFDAFYSSIIQDGNYKPMPQGATKLDECTINKLKAWKNKGFPQ